MFPDCNRSFIDFTPNPCENPLQNAFLRHHKMGLFQYHRQDGERWERHGLILRPV